ncbi:uncharacterized protein K460DRAFT_426257 [Cucurbitaria berberidis CBS 394.84]|uniref:Uncharacterized protein n=1 Tax=Cucurbitaria berberidis CBS 394.84 TaxID=1168544 RepID=A0A9P4L9S2_9PLEO|nr:uncharacterized protein K460DRAFT_426257 [Cucurbitaria berberidis CBS 394.84]KAF1847551.1 hypothetical protein K460DRAFT_426257 [Cucurbitaria berberidis CBS 394.84]
MGNAASTTGHAPGNETSGSVPLGLASSLPDNSKRSHRNTYTVRSTALDYTMDNEHTALDTATHSPETGQGENDFQSSPKSTNAQALDPADMPDSGSSHRITSGIQSVQGPEHQHPHKVGSKDAPKGPEGVADSEDEEHVPGVEISDIRNLQLAIGRERVPFLPKLSDLKLDVVTEKEDYLPVVMLVGTYISSNPRSNLNGLEVWAFHTIQDEDIFPYIEPHTPLELVAFSKAGEHVPNLAGTKPDDTWFQVKQCVQFLPEFGHLRSLAELLCLVRYCLLLAADEQLFGFDGSTIPTDMSFTRKLVDICNRRWDEQRFKTYEETGVMPEFHEIQKNVPKGKITSREAVEMFSESDESSGEDEIPDTRPEGYEGHLKRMKSI